MPAVALPSSISDHVAMYGIISSFSPIVVVAAESVPDSVLHLPHRSAHHSLLAIEAFIHIDT